MIFTIALLLCFGSVRGSLSEQLAETSLTESQWPMIMPGAVQFSGYSPYSGYWPYSWPSLSAPYFYGAGCSPYMYSYYGLQQNPYYATGYAYPQPYSYYTGYQSYPYYGIYGASVAPVVGSSVPVVAASTTPLVAASAAQPVVKETVIPVAQVVQAPAVVVETIKTAPAAVVETVQAPVAETPATRVTSVAPATEVGLQAPVAVTTPVSAANQLHKTGLSQDSCRAMFQSDGLFRSMFGVHGRHRRGVQDEYCWGNRTNLSQYMESVNEGDACDRDWEFPSEQPVASQSILEVLLGFDTPVSSYRSEHPNSSIMLRLHGTGDDKWNMCRELEFMACSSKGKIPGQTPYLRIVTSPSVVNVDDLLTHGQYPGWGHGLSPNFVTAWEYCYLGMMCKNGNDLFYVQDGGLFLCDIDGHDAAFLKALFETMLS